MKVGIVIVTHPGIGQALLDTAVQICPVNHAQVAVVEIPMGADLDSALLSTRKAAESVSGDGGVLLLTDLIGATPHNVAVETAEQMHIDQAPVPGLNLPMLLRTLNYAHLPADELAERARTGGRRGINLDPQG